MQSWSFWKNFHSLQFRITLGKKQKFFKKAWNQRRISQTFVLETEYLESMVLDTSKSESESEMDLKIYLLAWTLRCPLWHHVIWGKAKVLDFMEEEVMDVSKICFMHLSEWGNKFQVKTRNLRGHMKYFGQKS